jgi:hypothetical protein
LEQIGKTLVRIEELVLALPDLDVLGEAALILELAEVFEGERSPHAPAVPEVVLLAHLLVPRA